MKPVMLTALQIAQTWKLTLYRQAIGLGTLFLVFYLFYVWNTAEQNRVLAFLFMFLVNLLTLFKHPQKGVLLTEYVVSLSIISAGLMSLFYYYSGITESLDVLARVQLTWNPIGVIFWVIIFFPNQVKTLTLCSILYGILILNYYLIEGTFLQDFTLFELLIQPILLFVFSYVLNVYEKMYKNAQKENQVYKDLSMLDSLTGVGNRRAFEQQLGHIAEKSLPFSLIVFDIDRFKFINDTYGHAVGDMVLQKLCHLIQSKLPEQATLFRWGGEEFAVLLQNSRIKAAHALAEDLRQLVAKHRFPHVESLTISLGVAERTPESGTVGIFIDADEALLTAKNSGRNQTKVSSATLKMES